MADSPRKLPARIGVDADGYVWRDYGEGFLSMAPSNPDNKPTPEPITWYVPVLESDDDGHEYVHRSELGVAEQRLAQQDAKVSWHKRWEEYWKEVADARAAVDKEGLAHRIARQRDRIADLEAAHKLGVDYWRPRIVALRQSRANAWDSWRREKERADVAEARLAQQAHVIEAARRRREHDFNTPVLLGDETYEEWADIHRLLGSELDAALAVLPGDDGPACVGKPDCKNAATRDVHTNYGSMGRVCDECYAELKVVVSRKEGTT